MRERVESINGRISIKSDKNNYILSVQIPLANYEKNKVILVDDHELVRMGFRLLLEGANNLEVIAEFSSGEEVVNEFLNYEFDLIVIDISMPGIGGIEAIKRIFEKT